MKAFLEPTSGMFNSDSVSGEGVDENISGETTESNTQQIEKEEVKEDTTNEKNPQTGIENISLCVIVIAVVTSMFYLLIRNKKYL